jgi:predicted RNA-binding Zn ribbon-like protein
LTGEKTMHEEAPQPGNRQPAPGDLALVQAFLNTHYDLAGDGGDILDSPKALRRWLSAHELLDDATRHDDDGLQRVLAVREGLRALALANNDGDLDEKAVDALHEASRGATSEIRLEPDGARFVITRPANLDAALGALLAIVARAMIDGSWARLKACPGRDCGWVFFDRSRNQSARWCAMKVCGDREKARAYYERKRAER